mgnify:CR=1 FL=1
MHDKTAVPTENQGGGLFIDEVYSLAGDTEDNYGKVTIETILKAMEDHRVPFFIYMEE